MIFCVATYGEGDPTDNAQDLYEWLKERTESLKGLRYAVSHTGNGLISAGVKYILYLCISLCNDCAVRNVFNG